MTGTQKKAVAVTAFYIIIFIISVIKSAELSPAVLNSVLFCLRTVVPSLFFFIVLSDLIAASFIPQMIQAAFPKHGAEITAFIFGIVCGFPSGAIFANGLYTRGFLTKQRAERITAFSNNAGCSFIFGLAADSVGIFNALLIFSAQIFSAFLILFITKADDSEENIVLCGYEKINSLADSIKKSAQTMINICAFIIIFLSFAAFTSKLFIPEGPFSVLYRGIFEFSGAVYECSGLSEDFAAVAAAFFIGWSGLSVHFQIISVCGCLSPKPYIKGKLISAVSTPVFFVLLKTVFGGFTF